jgi:hypothetical protein
MVIYNIVVVQVVALAARQVVILSVLSLSRLPIQAISHRFGILLGVDLPVTEPLSRRRKLPELVSDHLVRDGHRHIILSIMHHES